MHITIILEASGSILSDQIQACLGDRKEMKTGRNNKLANTTTTITITTSTI